ncbi:MAG: hypothetical protein DYH08_00475 [Actinobacteria bacterium ATB1]|nr:hypothetical protein [Actinobacteria bacterium ATB1]
MTAASLPSATQTKKTSYLELFFDLVFVFAITQLAGTLHDDHTASGWGHAALLLWLVWWAWSQFTWAGNAIDVENRPTRIAMLAVTGLMLVAAVGIPDTFGTEAAWFAVPYAAVRFSGLAMYWFGLRGDQDHRRALLTSSPSRRSAPCWSCSGVSSRSRHGPGSGPRPSSWMSPAPSWRVGASSASHRGTSRNGMRSSSSSRWASLSSPWESRLPVWHRRRNSSWQWPSALQ